MVMTARPRWTCGTGRLPLRVQAPLLDDPGLYMFIGGEPASLPELRERYRRQAVGGTRDGSPR